MQAQRFLRGASSFLGMLLFPTGWWWCRNVDHLKTPERYQNGCVFVLPGIQGKSPIEFGLARGLEEGGVELAIEIFDWTTGLWPLFLFHLRSRMWHRRMAKKFVARIADYQTQYPSRPVYVIGHSGGGGLSLLSIEQLSQSHPITGLILLGPAVSPFYDDRKALDKTERGIWNIQSSFDVLFLGIGTIVAGTMDGWHWMSAGAIGFRVRDGEPIKQTSKRHQVKYVFSMCRSWNFGGHFGYTNRLFATDYLAPIVRGSNAGSVYTRKVP